ncbi:MAG: DUF4295 family protein [Flavobacteriales bacterium]
MAKKTVATLQTTAKKLTKAVKMVKSKKSGAWVFEEKILPATAVKDFFKA